MTKYITGIHARTVYLHSHGGGSGGGGVALVSAAGDVTQLHRPLYICGGDNGDNVLLIADHKNTISYT